MLDPFYLIVDRASWLERLLPAGVRLVQLRIKDQPEAFVREEVRAAKRLCADHGADLVINDHWRIAIEEGCDFIHLGQEDLADADIGAIRGAGCRLGVSTHDHRELEIALSVKPDYIALGPVFATTVKQMDWQPTGTGLVSEWRAALGDTPLVAIGGITLERAPGVLQAGADSAAVVTDVLGHVDPQARARAWIDATRSFVR